MAAFTASSLAGLIAGLTGSAVHYHALARISSGYPLWLLFLFLGSQIQGHSPHPV